MKEVKNAVIFTRVSDKRQEKALGLNLQLKDSKEFAKNLNINVIRVFNQGVYSVKDSHGPMFDEMLEYCKNSEVKIDYVIVWRVDRIVRDFQDGIVLCLYTLPSLGLSLRSVTEPIINIDSPNQLINALATLFQLYSAQDANIARKQRATSALKEKMIIGDYGRHLPIGLKYVLVDSRVKKTKDVVVQEDAKYVTLCFKWFIQDDFTTFVNIERRLNEIGFYKIKAKSIPRILTYRIYTGKYPKDKDSSQLITGSFQPVVDEELYFKVQEKLMARKKNPLPQKRDRESSEFVLSKKVLCPVCGTILTYSNSKGRHNDISSLYRCRNNCQILETRKSIRKDILHKNFEELLSNIILKPEVIKTINQEIDKFFNNILEEIDIKLLELEELLKKSTSFKEESVKKFVEGEITKEDYVKLKENYIFEEQKLKEEINNLIERRSSLLLEKTKLNINPTYFWENGEGITKNRLIKILFKNPLLLKEGNFDIDSVKSNLSKIFYVANN